MVRTITTTCRVAVIASSVTIAVAAQQPVPPPTLVAVRPIEPPATRLPPESASRGETRFSFISYGDTRSQVDGQALQPDHSAVVSAMLAKIATLASTRFPVRFVVHSGDAVMNGVNGAAWNTSFIPLVERITREANVPFFFAAGNHDVAYSGASSRAEGLHALLSANGRLIPPEGSPRRLAGYATYAFGYGSVFVVVIDSNVAADPLQLAWITDELQHLDRGRYRHVVAVFHHPLVSSGPHGGAAPGGAAPAADQAPGADNVERPIAEMRRVYAPLFRRFHVRLTLSGHEHLYEHWVERYTDGGVAYRRDDVVSGGGGAPIYTYRGEPEVRQYLAAGADENLQLEHVVKPGITAAENPHHFVVIQVDGDHLSLEIVSVGAPLAPYGGTARTSLN